MVPSPTNMPTNSPQPKLSRWLTRLQAIGFGILLLLLIELSCRFFGFGDKDIGNDPFVGFSALEPLFELNTETDQYETRRERMSYFLHDEFSSIKAPNTYSRTVRPREIRARNTPTNGANAIHQAQ